MTSSVVRRLGSGHDSQILELYSRPFLSDNDFKTLVERGEIQITPSPSTYNPVSIDLGIGAVYDVGDRYQFEVNGKPDWLFFKRADLARHIRVTPEKDSLWVLGTPFPDSSGGYFSLYDMGKKPLNYNGGWLLERNRKYVIELEESVWWGPQIEPELSMRSRYARSFLDITGTTYNKNDGKFFMEIMSWAGNVIYPEDRIAQLHFRQINGSPSPEIDLSQDWRKYAGLSAITFARRDYALVPLDGNALVMRDGVIDRKKFSAESFERINIFQDPLPPDSLILAKTNTIVRVPNGSAVRIEEGLFVGMDDGGLAFAYGPNIDYHMHLHPQAPYSQPGSNNRLVLEIPFPVNHPTYFKEMQEMGVPLVLLRRIPLTSPATSYQGRFRNQKDVLLPFN